MSFLTKALSTLVTILTVSSLASAMPSHAQDRQVQSVSPLTATPVSRPLPPPIDREAILTPVRAADGTEATVFGADLFSGAFAGTRATQQSDYTIQTGDQIAVRIYGAVNVDSVQTVDSGGALFIQGIGPVQVAGSPASQLQDKLTTALRGVYTDAVGVYVDVLEGGTLGVFLSGDVQRPGRYLGSPGDSVLYFLDQAGGIDPVRGSFRQVSVRRGGQTVASFDLYDFVMEGRIAPFNFRNGDVIHVGPRGPMVIVTGAATNAYAFEARPGTDGLLGSEIIALARPSGTATSIGVNSVRSGIGTAAFYPLNQFAQIQLGSGDHVDFQSDVFTETISVSVDGDIRGPSVFVVPRGAVLSQVLAQLPLDGSDVEQTYVHIERRSVALEQKAALDRALDNLERAALTLPSSSSQGAATAAAQADQISAFAARARAVQPAGKVAVYTNGQFNDLRLEAGDRIILPARSDVVVVAGEVLSPGAFAWGEGLRVRDYIDHAGGAAPNADRRRYALRRPDGSSTVVGANERPRAGDQIVVVPGFPSRSFLLFKDLTQIAFQIATTAVALINVSR